MRTDIEQKSCTRGQPRPRKAGRRQDKPTISVPGSWYAVFERTPHENCSEFTTINVTLTATLSEQSDKETHVPLRLVLARAGVNVRHENCQVLALKVLTFHQKNREMAGITVTTPLKITKKTSQTSRRRDLLTRFFLARDHTPGDPHTRISIPKHGSELWCLDERLLLCLGSKVGAHQSQEVRVEDCAKDGIEAHHLQNRPVRHVGHQDGQYVFHVHSGRTSQGSFRR